MHIVLTNPLLFLKGKNKNWVNWENWIRGGPFFKKIIRSKGEEREKIHNLEWWDVFCFDLLTINYHGNWYFLYICIYIYLFTNICIYLIYTTHIFIDLLAVRITVIISAVIIPIVFNTLRKIYVVWPIDLMSLRKIYVFIDKRWLFKPFSYETFVIYQFKIVTFVVSRTICSILFLL